MKSSKINELLGKINRTIENSAFPEVSKIELDLLKQHVRNLYDEIDTVTANTSAKPEATETTKQDTEKEFIKKPIMRANDNMFLNEQQPAAGKVAEFLKRAMVVTPEEKPIEQKQVTEEKPIVKAAKKETPVVAASINESIKSTGTLNEKLKTSSTAEMHKKLASKPLKELIDLNKRFVLLSELFKDNTEAYSAAIAHIDTLPDFESAQTFIKDQLVANYYWDETKQSTRMFVKLVKMKFGVE